MYLNKSIFSIKGKVIEENLLKTQKVTHPKDAQRQIKVYDIQNSFIFHHTRI